MQTIHEEAQILIYAEYTCCFAIDIEGICDILGIKKEDIQTISIKWNTMYLTMQNGDSLDYCLDTEFAYPAESISWKHPKSVYSLKNPFNDLSAIDNPFKETDTDTNP